ncbi:MAG: sensory rhodopsin transducer [Bdellovibrionia bacterium]
MIGSKRWAIAECYIPVTPNEQDPRFISHETACILNAYDQDAHVLTPRSTRDERWTQPYS